MAASNAADARGCGLWAPGGQNLVPSRLPPSLTRDSRFVTEVIASVKHASVKHASVKHEGGSSPPYRIHTYLHYQALPLEAYCSGELATEHPRYSGIVQYVYSGCWGATAAAASPLLLRQMACTRPLLPRRTIALLGQYLPSYMHVSCCTCHGRPGSDIVLLRPCGNIALFSEQPRKKQPPFADERATINDGHPIIMRPFNQNRRGEPLSLAASLTVMNDLFFPNMRKRRPVVCIAFFLLESRRG